MLLCESRENWWYIAKWTTAWVFDLYEKLLDAYYDECSLFVEKMKANLSDQKILQKYEMDNYDSFELLRKSGGKLSTDTLEFIDPILSDDVHSIVRKF